MRGISEAQIQETCCAFLELDGWRRIKTDLKHLRGMGVQEKGIADDLFIRYTYNWYSKPLSLLGERTGKCCAQVLWCEWKRARGGNGKNALFTKAEKAKIHQSAWHAAERARGALTIILGEDCPASIEGFMAWYDQSGLRRNIARRTG